MWSYQTTRTKPFTKSDQNHSNISPKMISDPPKIDPWRASETPWRPYWSQETYMYPKCTLSGSILDPKRDPKIDQKSIIVETCFWKTFWNHVFMLLASIWAPKTTLKWDQKGTQHENKKTSILLLFTTLAPHWGVQKIIILGTFLGSFLRYLFETSFSSILDPFGDPFGTLWAPKKHPKKHTKKRHQKRPYLRTCLSKGTGSAFKCSSVVPSTPQ